MGKNIKLPLLLHSAYSESVRWRRVCSAGMGRRALTVCHRCQSKVHASRAVDNAVVCSPCGHLTLCQNSWNFIDKTNCYKAFALSVSFFCLIFRPNYVWPYLTLHNYGSINHRELCAVHIVHPEYWTKRGRNRPCGGSNPHTRKSKNIPNFKN